MSAFILKVRNALEDIAPDWHWDFSSAMHAGESQFRIVARQKNDKTERTIYLTDSILHNLPLNVIVSDIVRLLPATAAKTATVAADRCLNGGLGQHYNGLRNDYREQVALLRRTAVSEKKQL